MADESDRLACAVSSFDESHGVPVFREVPERPMTTRVKDGVIVFVRNRRELDRRGKHGLGIWVGVEAAGQFCLEAGLIALRVEWRLAALRRGNSDLSPASRKA
jgi:hypothetical protein